VTQDVQHLNRRTTLLITHHNNRAVDTPLF
jgi:hypothetical protein